MPQATPIPMPDAGITQADARAAGRCGSFLVLVDRWMHGSFLELGCGSLPRSVVAHERSFIAYIYALQMVL